MKTSDLSRALADLAGGHAAALFSSGGAATAAALLAFLRCGDHLLVPSTVAAATRRFCEDFLIRQGMEVTFYDPLVAGAISERIQPNTRLVYLESPASTTFEVQDVPAITAAARRRRLVTVLDNSWATPVHFRSFEKGVDVVIDASGAVAGRSHLHMGMVIANRRCWPALQAASQALGQGVAELDAELLLQGLRTLKDRLARHQANAVEVAQWLARQACIKRVLYPALPGDPGHMLWRRDFTGASGLLGVLFQDFAQGHVPRMLQDLQIFGRAVTWGGPASLALPDDAVRAPPGGAAVRLHIGLEDAADLLADLRQACAVMPSRPRYARE